MYKWSTRQEARTLVEVGLRGLALALPDVEHVQLREGEEALVLFCLYLYRCVSVSTGAFKDDKTSTKNPTNKPSHQPRTLFRPLE